MKGNKIFEKASRLKLSFDTNKGQLSVSDLWDLPLSSTTGRVNLDDIAIGLNSLVQDVATVSFVKKDSKVDPVNQLKFDIVKHVIEVRLAENEAASKARDKAEQKQKILGLIARRQDEELSNKSVEDLTAMLNSL